MHERLPVTLGDLAQAVGGRVVAGAAETPIDGFSIDSRLLRRGDLFVAIRGEHFDGHAFVADAIGDYLAGASVMDVSGSAHSGVLSRQDLAELRETAAAELKTMK